MAVGSRRLDPTYENHGNTPLLVLRTADQLATETEPRRFLHLLLLEAVRDRAEWVEVRFGEGYGLVYQKADGREWELAPPPEDVYPHLKAEIRAASRLVWPERPAVSIAAAPSADSPAPPAEPLEVGWLTYQLGDHLLDLLVRIAPREPWGFARIEIHDVDADLAEAAGETVAAFYALPTPEEIAAAAPPPEGTVYEDPDPA